MPSLFVQDTKESGAPNCNALDHDILNKSWNTNCSSERYDEDIHARIFGRTYSKTQI